MYKLHLGNNKEVLKDFAENSIDSIVTDPPYELGFMGKSWDSTGIAYDVELWKECLRVLKPGGYILAFSGTRTYHRMAVAIEDAGFEVRDMIEWIYGSGFPKSLNIGKAVDKLGNIEGIKIREEIKNLIINSGKTDKELAIICNVSPTLVRFWRLGERNILQKEADKLKEIIGNNSPKSNEREVVGLQKKAMSGWNMDGTTQFKDRDVTKGTSEYEGWGTALKPAHEPICMARKPLAEKTVAENCLKWGTGGINIDASRVETSDKYSYPNGAGGNSFSVGEEPDGKRTEPVESNTLGRFPANLIHDNSEEVRECFPETKTNSSGKGGSFGAKNPSSINLNGEVKAYAGDSGNASRFFKSIIYEAKASKTERNRGCEAVFNLFEQSEGLEEKEIQGRDKGQDKLNNPYKLRPKETTNIHPTVKPISLMEYLIKMVTPKGGIVLDPFNGSGSTGCAAVKNGFDYHGIDITKEYITISEKRIKAY